MIETSSTHINNCLNCATPYESEARFCSVCGQKTTTHRFSLKSIFKHDALHLIFHLEKGFVSTLIHVFKKPGTVVKEYLDGKRVKHFNYLTLILILIAFGHFLNVNSPIKLIDLMGKTNKLINKKEISKIDTTALIGSNYKLDSTTLVILNSKIDSLENRKKRLNSVEVKLAKQQDEVLNSFDRFTKENPKKFYLYLLPLYTIISFMWFYRSKLNFSEHLILNIYKTCGDIIIGITMTLGFYAYPKLSFWTVVYPFSTLFIIAYGTWFYYSVFKQYYKDSGIVFLKSLAAIITVQITIGIISAVYMLILLINTGMFK